jgi:D-alanyl-D-alanine carboxypeptidase
VLARLLALIAMLATPASFHSSVAPVPRPVRAELRASGFYSHGCPVPLSQLRLLTVSYRDFHGHTRRGQLVVNRSAARPLARVFRRLYRIHFPIRHMTLSAIYGTRHQRPADGDVTASFECRQAAASPCVGRVRTGSWSMHAYGLAVDLNPAENPYVGCGQSMDPSLRRYRVRTHHYKGMVGGRVVRAFRSIGWGWGGSWAGSTKDYMHFSSTGH